MASFVNDFVSEGVDNYCCQCWKDGCGCDKGFALCADCLDFANPVLEQVGDLIWIFGSPLAFCCIFFFPSDPHTDESSGYEISMLQAPIRRPVTCCAASFCAPCAQWYVRRQVLGGDMTKYKLWQGYHDGPHCCARFCPSAPITIEAGTYGEEKCPEAFLCLEVCCLGGFYSICCAFDVSRQYQRAERGLSIDPTEHRQHKCIGFFSEIMHTCFQLGCCLSISSCLVAICAQESAGAQECAGEGGRAARNCCRIARTLWKGILWTRCIGMGCATTQMIHEAEAPWDGRPKARPEKMVAEAPKNETMNDRGAACPSFKQGSSHETSKLLMPWEK